MELMNINKFLKDSNLKTFNILFILIFLMITFSCEKKIAYDLDKYEKMVSLRNLGLAYIEEENFTEAINIFKNLIEIAPNEPLGYANLGLAYLNLDENYDLAEPLIKKAIDLDSDNPDLRNLLVLYHELINNDSLALEALKINISKFPNHIPTLYKLFQYYRKNKKGNFNAQNQEYLIKIIQQIPNNIVAQLDYIDNLISDGKTSLALNQTRVVQQILPKLSNDAENFLNVIINELESEKLDKAKISAIIFRNLVKPNKFYQTDIEELKGLIGPLNGSPIVRFRYKPKSNSSIKNNQPYVNFIEFNILDRVNNFNDSIDPVLKNETIPLIISLADFDIDGDIDIFISKWNDAEKKNYHYIFVNEDGLFENLLIKKDSDAVSQNKRILSFDYNNDGYIDILLFKENKIDILKNNGNYQFETKKSIPFNLSNLSDVTFFDFDIEGDLDFLVIKRDQIIGFQNTFDGRFNSLIEIFDNEVDQEENQLITHADFDNDGDIDALIVKQNGRYVLFDNQRGGEFKKVVKNGLVKINQPGNIGNADYNNDGYADIFISSINNGNHFLYKNLENGKFILDQKWEKLKNKIPKINGHDFKFFDFDNDGYKDLVIVGENKSLEQKNGNMLLLHNDQNGSFKDLTTILPPVDKLIKKVEIFDIENDGDLDILIVTKNGKLKVYKNEGGNLKNYFKVRLAGLRTGSGKNNFFGIGSKIEIKSGMLYQSQYMNSSIAHFGLGNNKIVDVMRVTWSNGVPQNNLKLKRNQIILEKQILKGSCPYLFVWNGDSYQFATDVLWPSALGMPLGIMAGEPLYAFPNSTDEYLKIPSNLLKSKNGKYSLKFTTELWETPYLDKVELLVVDHPDSVISYIDETFTPPPFKPLRIFIVEKKFLPVLAKDDNDQDILDRITKLDQIYVSNIKMDQFQGVTKTHDIIINFQNLNTEDSLYLFLNGWLFPTDASINVNLSQTDDLKSIFPFIQVKNKYNQWETVIENIGFPKGKNKTMIIDMTDKFLANNYQVRIRTNMQIYWDQIFMANNSSKANIKLSRLKPISANLHFRGFSKIKKKNYSSPHFPEYSNIDKKKKWRDLVGNYTKYGNTLSLLLDSDNKYVIMNSGDELALEFDELKLPNLKKGWRREFIFYNDGWLKDGDLNTAFGKSVAPLPFHGMSSYPEGALNGYPKEKELLDYQKIYNTRRVDNSTFNKMIKNY